VTSDCSCSVERGTCKRDFTGELSTVDRSPSAESVMTCIVEVIDR
jgi:hypothetical protein